MEPRPHFLQRHGYFSDDQLVQQLYGLNGGDTYLTTTIGNSAGQFAASTVRDGKTGDLIIKLVNGDASAKPLHLEFNGAAKLSSHAVKTVLAGADADVVNPDGGPAEPSPRCHPSRSARPSTTKPRPIPSP
ncbi:MAG: hypothetical protein QM796_12070 [Chthoniobacteraceae bacterium]